MVYLIKVGVCFINTLVLPRAEGMAMADLHLLPFVRSVSDAVPCSLYIDCPRSSQPHPLGTPLPMKTQGRNVDCHLLIPGTKCRRVFF